MGLDKKAMKYNQPPMAMEEILSWAKVNRPDMLPYLEDLAESIPTMGEKGDAYILLVSVAFTAGRHYQRSFGDNGNLVTKSPYGG